MFAFQDFPVHVFKLCVIRQLANVICCRYPLKSKEASSRALLRRKPTENEMALQQQILKSRLKVLRQLNFKLSQLR